MKVLVAALAALALTVPATARCRILQKDNVGKHSVRVQLPRPRRTASAGWTTASLLVRQGPHILGNDNSPYVHQRQPGPGVDQWDGCADRVQSATDQYGKRLIQGLMRVASQSQRLLVQIIRKVNRGEHTRA
jgi:hypothetical protein